MPRFKVSRVVKAPREKVWRVAAKPESMLEWWPGSESIDILSRERNTITIRGTGIEGGRRVTMIERWTLYPPEKIELEILEGPVLGRTIQTYEEVPEGTKVTWSSDIKFKGVLGRILGRLILSRIKNTIGQPLEALAKHIEAQ